MVPVVVLTTNSCCGLYGSSDPYGLHELCVHRDPCGSMSFVNVEDIVVRAVVAVIVVIAIMTIMAIVMLVAVLTLVGCHCTDGLIHIALSRQPYCVDCLLQILINFIMRMVSSE